MRSVVLISGGVDSTVLLHHLAARGEAGLGLSIDYGSKHNLRELPCAVWQCRALGVAHQVVALPFIDELFASSLLRSGAEVPPGNYDEATMKQTVVPFRNGILLAIAAGLAESRGLDAVAIAAHGGDHRIYPDCRDAFFTPMAEALTHGTDARIGLQRPFVEWSKGDIVRRGVGLGVDFARTWSCYRGGERPCGECGTCLERAAAFAAAGLDDPAAGR